MAMLAPGPNIVIGIEIEVADGAGVVVALQVAADLVVAIAEAVGKEAAAGVEQQARGFDGAAGDDDDVGELLLQVTVVRQSKRRRARGRDRR